MKLTPLDIKRHSFEKGFRGYDPAEVDGYLKQIADQFESLQEELRLAHERTRDTEAKLQHYERVEMALQEALESAKASAKRSEEDAARRSAVILEEAELRAQQILQDVERERFGMKQDLVRLSSRQAEVAARLRGFLMSELEVLSDFQGGAPAGLLRMDDTDPLLLSPGDADAFDDALAEEAEIADGAEPADTSLSSDVTVPAQDGAASPTDHEPAAAAPTLAAPPVPFEPTHETPGHEAAIVEPDPLDWSDSLPVTPTDTPPPYAPPTPDSPLVDIGSRAHEDNLPPVDSEILGPPTPIAPDDVPLSSGGWMAPSDANVAGSEAERERIRRILEDLD